VITDPAIARIEADIAEPAFASGLEDGRWRILSFNFPILNFAIAATEPDGKASEYGFRAELSNFPSAAPHVRIWDQDANSALPAERRPKGGGRVEKTFQVWSDDTVYRPWERNTGPHNNIATTLPHLAWRPSCHLSFIFEDLHAILNSNAIASALRASA
jgi:hypothetical protein